MEIPHDEYIEGSLRAVDRNLRRVDFIGFPTVIEELASVEIPVLN